MLPSPWTHRGYDIDRLVGHMYMTLEGIFGTPIDVSSTFIILFTIWGAFLEFSGAGKFFIDFSFAAMGGKPTGAGRTVTLASFLLGGPSGSGVATTVTLGSVAYPMLAKAGYSREAAGGLLSAGGIGAILSPPVLGAAAFLIAEFLKISYLDVIVMACIPTCLYYWCIFLMVELDAKKFGVKEVAFDKTYSLGRLTTLYGFHFISLVSIVVIMVIGYTPIMAVFWATVITFLVSFIRKETALRPRKLIKALRGGSIGVLTVGSTCAAAGIIVGVVTLTGLGLKFSSIIIAYAGGSVFFTAVYTAIIVWVIGLAVPVTASYIIAVVIAAPALIQLGVPDFAAHMFVFLLCDPLRGLASHGPLLFCGGCPHQRKPVQDDHVCLEVYASGFHRSLHVHAGSQGDRDPSERSCNRCHLDDPHRLHRHRRPGRRRGELVLEKDHLLRASPVAARRTFAGLPRTPVRYRRTGLDGDLHRFAEIAKDRGGIEAKASLSALTGVPRVRII